MNLQICFMNKSAADADSPSSDSESCPKLSKPPTTVRYSSAQANPYNSRPLSIKKSQSSEKGMNRTRGPMCNGSLALLIYIRL